MALFGTGPLRLDQLLHIPSTDAVASVVLTSGTPEQITPPSGARVAVFSFGADIWVNYGASTDGAIAPAASSSAGSTQSAEFNPTTRWIGSTADCTGINVYSDFTCKGSVSFYG